MARSEAVGRVGKGLRGCKPSRGGGGDDMVGEGRFVGEGKGGRSPSRVGLKSLSPKLFQIIDST